MSSQVASIQTENLSKAKEFAYVAYCTLVEAIARKSTRLKKISDAP